jgi:hypothetical protein
MPKTCESDVSHNIYPVGVCLANDQSVQSYIQHYSEPQTTTPGATSLHNITSAYGGGPLLPLGPGTLTLNQ